MPKVGLFQQLVNSFKFQNPFFLLSLAWKAVNVSLVTSSQTEPIGKSVKASGMRAHDEHVKTLHCLLFLVAVQRRHRKEPAQLTDELRF